MKFSDVPSCLGFYVRGQMAAERECETCPFLSRCSNKAEFRPDKLFKNPSKETLLDAYVVIVRAQQSPRIGKNGGVVDSESVD